MEKTNERIDIPDLLKGVDLAKLVESDGVTLRGMSEKYGPCPKCKGNDRFHVRSGYGDRDYFFCRQCHEKRGDAIDYMRWTRDLSFADALQILAQMRGQYTMPDRRVTIAKPSNVAPSLAWQTMARRCVEWCERQLWADHGARALGYLHWRGLTDETIKRFHLGFNPQGLTRDWGIAGRVSIASGITIPREIMGELWAVNVRRLNANGTQYKATGNFGKYQGIDGSKAGALFGADSLKDAWGALVLGGEFDAILAAQHAPNGVAVVTFGGEGAIVRETWRAMLANVPEIYLCLDNDATGDSSVSKWFDVPRVRRVRVPAPHKDLTEFAQAGGDVADWIGDTLNTPLTRAVMSWGESKGYAPAIDGSHVTMWRDVDGR